MVSSRGQYGIPCPGEHGTLRAAQAGRTKDISKLILTSFRPELETPASRPQIPTLSIDDKATLKFTDIMNNLQHVYPKQQMGDISTSFGFICLLHLANEKGLVIENVDGWTDLTVRRDFDAIVSEGDL